MACYKRHLGAEHKTQKARLIAGASYYLGNVLLSHTLARAVPGCIKELKGLTSVFGMGTGGSPSLQSPKSRWPLSAFIWVHRRPEY
jgi:hypothetical protein